MEARIDYTSVLRAFVDQGIDFAVAGGFAVVAHGPIRVTMDLDLALADEKGMKAASFFHEKQPFLVVDLLFTEEFRFTKKNIEYIPLFGIECPVLDIPTLIKLKTIAGREKDLDDINALKMLIKKT